MTNYDMDELRRRGEIPDEVERRREFARDIIESEKIKNQPQLRSVKMKSHGKQLI